MALSISENPPEAYLPGHAITYASGSAIASTEELSDNAIPAAIPSTAQLVPLISRITPGWMVAQTQYRREKQLAAFLEFHKIPYFLPYSRSWASSPENESRSTRNRVLIPMFEGFVFVAARMPENPDDPGFQQRFSRSDLDRDLLLTITKDLTYASGNVLGFLHTKNQPRLAAELALIASFSPESRRSVSDEERIASLRVGVCVRVCGGPFEGIEGKVGEASLMGNGSGGIESRGGGGYGAVKMVVDLHLMGRKVAVEVDRDLLEPTDH